MMQHAGTISSSANVFRLSATALVKGSRLSAFLPLVAARFHAAPSSPVDNVPLHRLIPAVPVIRRVFVLLLLAAWLPAVMHCDLEAAGVAFATECCERSGSVDGNHCAPGRCEVAESDFTLPSDSELSAPAPTLCACLLCCLSLPELPAHVESAPNGLDESTAAPPELNARWVFVARAALSPRAPSLAS
jgi:hypothetical protein